METQSDTTDEVANIKEIRQKLESRIETLRNSQLQIISSFQNFIPDIASSLDLHLKVVSSFNGSPFTPLPNPLPTPNPNTKRRLQSEPLAPTIKISKLSADLHRKQSENALMVDEIGSGSSPLATVRSMVAVFLLERVPFTEIDSLKEVAGGDSIVAVEMALRSMAEDNGGVQFEEFRVNGKVRVSVKGIDRTRLVKELPESKQNDSNSNNSAMMGQRDVNV